MTSYDLVPYDGSSYAHTHPDVLATIATLRGMQPASIGTCRVLELGCAGGRNLIPMALTLPNAQFVGLDRSLRQIAAARELAAELGVTNVVFRQQEIEVWADDPGTFDYIIAHGVYSWVPVPVRRALLKGCRRALADQGVAYVSYNTYPGWHMLETMRRMMQIHIRGIDDPAEQARQARQLIQFLVDATEQRSLVHASMLSAFHYTLSNYWHGILNLPDRTDSLFLHDELEENNDPFYFHEFRSQVEGTGLTYLGDAEYDSTLPISLPPDIRAQLLDLVPADGDLEQYLDFVRNRTFRRSLLVPGHVQLGDSINLDTLDNLYFAGTAPLLATDLTGHPEEDKPAEDKPAETNVAIGDGNARLVTDHPVTIVAFDHLRSIWPARASLDQLLDIAYHRLLETNPHLQTELLTARSNPNSERRLDDRAQLAENLLLAFCTSSDLVSFHMGTGCFTMKISETPQASRWARWQARQGSREVTDLRFRRAPMDDTIRFLLPLLDGNQTLDSLVGLALHQPGAVDLVRAADRTGFDADLPLAVGLRTAIEEQLHVMARMALLQS